MSKDLLKRLSGLCAKVFSEDFGETRAAGRNLILRLGIAAASREPGAGIYNAWCREHLGDGLGGLLEKYPVLCRLIALACSQWRLNAAALVRRVHADRDLLERRFNIPADAPLIDVAWGLSDPHRGGQSVALLTFGTSTTRFQVVYKPKDLRIEQHYQEVIAEVG